MLCNKRICSKQRPTQKTHILEVTGEHSTCPITRVKGYLLATQHLAMPANTCSKKAYIKTGPIFSLWTFYSKEQDVYGLLFLCGHILQVFLQQGNS